MSKCGKSDGGDDGAPKLNIPGVIFILSFLFLLAKFLEHIDPCCIVK